MFMFNFRLFILVFVLVFSMCPISNSNDLFALQKNDSQNSLGNSEKMSLNNQDKDNIGDSAKELDEQQESSEQLSDIEGNASLQVKLEQLEYQNRLLNGKVEELKNSLQNLEQVVVSIKEKVQKRDEFDQGDNNLGYKKLLHNNDEQSYSEEYKDALLLIRKGEYEEAKRKLESFIESNDDKDILSKAYYWLGEIYYALEIYKKSAINFLQSYKLSPYSDKAIDTLNKLGLSLLSLGKDRESCSAFDKLLSEFPNLSPSMKKEISLNRSKAGC